MRNSIFVSPIITKNKEANVSHFYLFIYLFIYIISHFFQHKGKQHFQKIKQGRKI